jgi:hypothetical protein
VNCAFDRQRGEFIVKAGARAGACAIVTCAALAIGAFGYVRSAVFGGPGQAAAATLPADNVVTTTTPKRSLFETTQPVAAKPACRTGKSFAKTSGPKPAAKRVAVNAAVDDDAPASAAESPKHHEPAPTTAAAVKSSHGRKKSNAKSEGQRT